MELLLAIVLGLNTPGAPVVVNADFEQRGQRSDSPSGWMFTTLPDRQDLVSYQLRQVTADNARTTAVSITVAADHPAGTVAYNIHQDLDGVVAGKTYRVSARVQSEGLTTLPMIVVQCLDASGSRSLGYARSPERKLTTDIQQWQQVETDVTIPEGSSTMRLRIGIPAEGNAGGTALIDDVAIVEVP